MASTQTKQTLFSTSFWTDDFIGNLSRDCRHFFQYLITSPERNVSGIYRSSYRLMQFHDGWTPEEVDQHFETLSKAGKAFFYKQEWVIIINGPTHHRFADEDNRWNGVANMFRDAPEDVQLFALENGYMWDYIMQHVSPSYKGFRGNSEELAEKLRGNNPSEGSHRVAKGSEGSETLADPDEHINLNSNSNSNSKEKESREAAVSYLNEKTGKSFKPNSDKTKRHIDARLRENYTLEDLKYVIDVKCEEWLGDAKMEPFLRPETLFGSKFEAYLNQRTKKQAKPLVPSCPSCGSHEYYGGVCKACGYVEGAA